MDAAILSQVMGGAVPMSRYEALAPAFSAAMVAADITTVQRAAMWCAQLGHESGGLRWMEEIADGAAYEGRQDLGNTQRGDGRRFKGRGPIQVTGRHNYTACSKWAHSRGLVPTVSFFVDQPQQLASDQYGFIGPVWYWIAARPQLNALADAGDVPAATRVINGGLTNLDDRKQRYNRALAIGRALLPIKENSMSAADNELTKRFPSRSKYRGDDKPVDTLAGFILNVDARIHEEYVEREALKGTPWCVELVKREAARGDAGAQAILKEIEAKK